jgi:predicted Zn-dependent protease
LVYPAVVETIKPPDAFCVQAAIGWLELGNPAEARAELAGLAPGHQAHPQVLELRWFIACEEKDWETGLEIARQTLRQSPDQVFGYVHQAYSLRRIQGGGLKAAYDALRPAADRFPQEEIVPYNLACYCAQMGKLDEAWAWLQRALRAAKDPAIVVQRTFQDDDLAPLWERLRKSPGE